MFTFKKILTPFLLPPGILIFFLLILGIWLIRGRSQKPAWICLTLALIIWFFSLGVISDRLMAPLESAFPVPDNPKGDVIIMLGGGVFDKAEDMSGRGVLGPGTLERMVTAARLQRRLKIPILVSGGSVYSENVAIAPLTRRYLIDLGIPEDQIIVENQSRDTYENALYSNKICRKRNLNKPILVTSGYHLKRAKYCFDLFKIKVTPFPCALTTWPDKSFSWDEYLPSAYALNRTSDALHEWLGLLYYRMTYSP